MATRPKGAMVRVYYLNWRRAGEERQFMPFDIGDVFVERCVELWNGQYYVRGDEIRGLPRWRPDHIEVCNQVFEMFNRDDRLDALWRRSMSVSDIVSIGDQDFYLCRGSGWTKIDVAYSKPPAGSRARNR